MSGLGSAASTSLEICTKLLLRRKKGNPRTGSCTPPLGATRASNSIEPFCAAAGVAIAANAAKSKMEMRVKLFMPLIVADGRGCGYEWVHLVNVSGKGNFGTAG